MRNLRKLGLHRPINENAKIDRITGLVLDTSLPLSKFISDVRKSDWAAAELKNKNSPFTESVTLAKTLKKLFPKIDFMCELSYINIDDGITLSVYIFVGKDRRNSPFRFSSGYNRTRAGYMVDEEFEGVVTSSGRELKALFWYRPTTFKQLIEEVVSIFNSSRGASSGKTPSPGELMQNEWNAVMDKISDYLDIATRNARRVNDEIIIRPPMLYAGEGIVFFKAYDPYDHLDFDEYAEYEEWEYEELDSKEYTAYQRAKEEITSILLKFCKKHNLKLVQRA